MVNLMDRWVPHDRAWGLGSVETSGTGSGTPRESDISSLVAGAGSSSVLSR
jgi:hypothetical protein